MHALFMIDADNFKKLNDTYGHQAGDEFLVRFAKELKNCFDDGGIAGRIGGDEFFALIPDVPDVESVQASAEELLNNVRKVCGEYAELGLSASIGIGLYPTNGRSIGQLYAFADKAMYQAKRKGKNQIVFQYQQPVKELKFDMLESRKTEEIKQIKI